jgi:hypothetical protein
MRMRFAAFLISLVSLFMVSSPALAMDQRTADQVVVKRDEVINDNVLLTGASIVVDGTINGDLLAFGDSIVINGTLNGNLIAAGNQIHLNGQIGRGALLGGTRIKVGGQIGKELKAWVTDLRVGPGAVIEGPVDYTSGRPATIEAGARTGAVSHHRVGELTAASSFGWRVFRFLGFLPVGMAALAWFPGLRRRYPEIILERPWRAPLAGLVAMLAVPVGMLLLLITLIGIPLSLVTLTLSPALIYLSQVLVSWTVGKLLTDKVARFRSLRWPVVFLMGAFLTSVVTALPGVGCLFRLAALLYGLGGLYYLMISGLHKANPCPQEESL